MLSGTPVYVGSAAEARERFPAMFRVPSALAQHAWAAVPLRAGGVVIGALGVGFAEERDFPPAERRFLETVADQCALAVERTRLYGTAATERERLAAVLSRLPAGVIIGEAPTGRLVLGNAEVERIWRQPFRASVDFDSYGTYRGFHPDGRPYDADEWPLARSLARGEVVTGEEVDFERGDGTRGTMVVNSAPIHDADGTVTAAVCTFVDITDRAEARRRLDAAYAAERRARAAAEAAGERLGRLQQITAGLAEALTVQQVAAVIVRGGLSVAGCRSAWIGVLDETGEALGVLAASFPVEPDGPAARIPLSAASPRAEVTRTGQPVWLSSAADALARYPGLRAIGIADGALGVVPLVSHGRPIGAMMLSFADEGAFDAAERALITTLAEQCAQALERARLQERSHDVALALQQSMLPSALPEVDGLELAARYHPAVESLEVGGDWYDVVALPDGRVALAVGDVVGRGLRAATTMGQLRSALAALALSTESPALVLDGLERFARQVEGARLATVVYGVLDPAAGTFRYACAGHPPPLVLRPDGATELLEEGRSPLLCALPEGPSTPRAEGSYLPGAGRPAAALLRRPDRAAPGVADRGPAPAGRVRGGGRRRARLAGQAGPPDDRRRRRRRRGAARGGVRAGVPGDAARLAGEAGRPAAAAAGLAGRGRRGRRDGRGRAAGLRRGGGQRGRARVPGRSRRADRGAAAVRRPGADPAGRRHRPVAAGAGAGRPRPRAAADARRDGLGPGRARGGRDGGHHATPVGSGMSEPERSVSEERAR